MKNLFVLFLLLFLIVGETYANSRMAILEVELDDGTLLPNVASEIKRTASFKPLLENAFKHQYDIVTVAKAVQQYANAGKGYLFAHHDLSAELGKQLGADWVLVSQHRKLSFMYSTLLVHLINVKTQQLAGNYFVELKGNNQTVTEHSIHAMADKIFHTLNK